MFQTLEHAIEEGRASLALDVAAPPITHEEIPSPLAELALQFDKALPEPLPEPKPEPNHPTRIPTKTGTARSRNRLSTKQYSTDGTRIRAPAAEPRSPRNGALETARVSLPRLSELRGMRFSQALRELDRAKRTAPANASTVSLNRSLNDAVADRHDDTPNEALNDLFNDPINETLMSAIAPFEPMFASAASSPEAQNRATAMNQNGAQGRTSVQTFFPPKPALPERRRSHREQDGGRSPRDPKAPGKETDAFLDQLHILPSRRGQYKKKG